MKKLISTIMALTVACTGLATMNVQAISRPLDLNADILEGYEELYHIESEYSHSVFMKKYTGDGGSTYRDYIYVKTIPSLLVIETYESNTPDARITDILSSYKLNCHVETAYSKYGVISYESVIPENFALSRELYDKIAEIAKVQKFKIYGSTTTASGSGYIPFKSPTYYVHGISTEQIDSLAEYVEEKNLDFTLERGNLAHEDYELYECNLIPNYDITLDEHIEIAADIANTLGIDMPIVYQEMTGNTSISNDIDILNSLNGDSNEDGNINIADATAIIQHIGNRDQYGLSVQGEFNADINNDGIVTGEDALIIQQRITEKGISE